MSDKSEEEEFFDAMDEAAKYAVLVQLAFLLMILTALVCLAVM